MTVSSASRPVKAGAAAMLNAVPRIRMPAAIATVQLTAEPRKTRSSSTTPRFPAAASVLRGNPGCAGPSRKAMVAWRTPSMAKLTPTNRTSAAAASQGALISTTAMASVMPLPIHAARCEAAVARRNPWAASIPAVTSSRTPTAAGGSDAWSGVAIASTPAAATVSASPR